MIATLAAGAATLVLTAHFVRPAPRSERTRRLARTGRAPRHTGRVAAVLGAAIAMLLIGLMPVAIVAALVVLRPRLMALLAERERQRAIDTALPDAIELLILVIHAGLTPHQALATLAQRAPDAVRPAFSEVQHRAGRGIALADALGALPERLGPRAAPVADTLAMAERHGTPIAQTLEQLAADVRERRRRQSEAEARMLPIKMSFPLVACTLPSFVLIAIVPALLAALGSLRDNGF